MKSVHSYLNFNEQAEEAMNFHKSVYDGAVEDNGVIRIRDTRGYEKINTAEKEKNRVVHSSLPLIENNVLMASDILPSMGHKLAIGNNNYMSLAPDSQEESNKLFSGLFIGGEVEMPVHEQFRDDYFGSFKDKYGVCWTINFSNRSE